MGKEQAMGTGRFKHLGDVCTHSSLAHQSHASPQYCMDAEQYAISMAGVTMWAELCSAVCHLVTLHLTELVKLLDTVALLRETSEASRPR